MPPPQDKARQAQPPAALTRVDALSHLSVSRVAASGQVLLAFVECCITHVSPAARCASPAPRPIHEPQAARSPSRPAATSPPGRPATDATRHHPPSPPPPAPPPPLTPPPRPAPHPLGGRSPLRGGATLSLRGAGFFRSDTILLRFKHTGSGAQRLVRGSYVELAVPGQEAPERIVRCEAPNLDKEGAGQAGHPPPPASTPAPPHPPPAAAATRCLPTSPRPAPVHASAPRASLLPRRRPAPASPPRHPPPRPSQVSISLSFDGTVFTATPFHMQYYAEPSLTAAEPASACVAGGSSMLLKAARGSLFASADAVAQFFTAGATEPFVSVAAEYDEDYDAMRLSTPSLGAEQLHALGGHDKVLDAEVKLALDGQTAAPGGQKVRLYPVPAIDAMRPGCAPHSGETKVQLVGRTFFASPALLVRLTALAPPMEPEPAEAEEEPAAAPEPTGEEAEAAAEAAAEGGEAAEGEAEGEAAAAAEAAEAEGDQAGLGKLQPPVAPLEEGQVVEVKGAAAG